MTAVRVLVILTMLLVGPEAILLVGAVLALLASIALVIAQPAAVAAKAIHGSDPDSA